MPIDGVRTQSYVRGMELLSRLLTRYWGYLAVLVAVTGYFLHGFAPAVILALSVAAVGYFLFQAPVWCGAETRENLYCRRNSNGLIRGCSFRQHKWQRLKQTFTPAGGRAIIDGCKSIGGALTALGGVVAGISVLISGGRLLLH